MRYTGSIELVKGIETVIKRKVPLHLVDKGDGADLFGVNIEPSKLQTLKYHLFDNRDLYYFWVKFVYNYRDNTAMFCFAERDGGRIFRILPVVVKLIGELKPYYGEPAKENKGWKENVTAPTSN